MLSIPLYLQSKLKGFILKSGSGDTLASVNRFFIDLEAESILNWALTWREITIEEPRLNVIINEAGHMNIMQLLPESQETEERKEESKEATIPSIIIHNLNILQGRTQLTDLSRPTPLQLGFHSSRFAHPGTPLWNCTRGRYGSIGPLHQL